MSLAASKLKNQRTAGNRPQPLLRARRALFIFAFSLLFSASAFSSPRLEVVGKDLLSDGNPVTLRGVSVGDPFLARQGRPLSDYATIAKEWKANVVRLDIHPSVWKSTPHRQVIETLRANVDAALQNGLFVVIDWHCIGFPDGYYEKPGYSDDPRDLYDSSFALAKEFWTEISKAFGGESRVLFELWCEPLFKKDDFDPPAGQKWPKLKPFMEQLTALIRQHGDNVVLATSNYWAYNLRGIRHNLLPGKNIAYSWHIYAGHDENDEAAWARALDDLQTVAPVIVTEWGFQRHTREHFKGSPESFGNKFVRDFLEARHLHSIAWCWHPEWTPPMLQDDWKTPTEMGRFVKDYLGK
jgi:hypothetical protein